jgi:hypothetical protein
VYSQLYGHFAGTHEALPGGEYTTADERNDLIGNLFIDRGGRRSVYGDLSNMWETHVGGGEYSSVFVDASKYLFLKHNLGVTRNGV